MIALYSVYSRLPAPLRIFLSWYGFFAAPIAVFVVMGLGGYTPLKLGAALLVVLALIVYWMMAHARPSRDLPKDSEALLQDIQSSGKYAMLAFQSEYCIASTTVGQRLEALERANPDRFQMYKLSVLDHPGKELFQKFDGKVTPTYVLLDPRGNVMMDWPMVLSVERVSYLLRLRGETASSEGVNTPSGSTQPNAEPA